MENLTDPRIDLLLDELFFPLLPSQAAEAAGLGLEEAMPLLLVMQAQGLIRREDHKEEPLNEQTLLVCTKKGLLQANGL